MTTTQDQQDQAAAVAVHLLRMQLLTSKQEAARHCHCSVATMYRRANRWALKEAERLKMRLQESHSSGNR